jgi:hypothetical protein
MLGRAITLSLPTATTMEQPCIPHVQVRRDAAARRNEKILKFASRLKTGKKEGGGCLQQDAQGVRTKSSNQDVLLRRRA